jgi:Putative zinc-finger
VEITCEYMDHKHIEQFDLVSRYVMGRLAPEESARFEEHFIDCPECIDRLTLTRELRDGLRLMAVERASETDRSTPPNFLGRIRQVISNRRFALAAGCLFLAVAAGILLIVHTFHLQGEIDEAKSAAARSESRYESELESALLADKMRNEREGELRHRLKVQEAELDQMRERAKGGGVGVADWTSPQINLPIFVLKSLRGGEGPSSGPLNNLVLPKASSPFLISIPLEGEDYTDYRITIYDSSGRSLWQRRGLKRDSHNSLSIGFNSRLFRRGGYLLKVEGVANGRDVRAVGDYPFRIAR